MNTSRLEWKVGLFVLLSLAFAAALIMKFSKGTSVLTRTYELLLSTSNVGGIRPGASVLMAGVRVGSVKSVDLDPSGKTATMHVQIESRYLIREDAFFSMEQAGFLGDQYISITPVSNTAPVLKPGASVVVEEAFNLQEAARSGTSLLRKVDQTVSKVNGIVDRIDRTILSEQALTNLAVAVSNFRLASDRALTTLHGVDELVQTNTPPLTVAVSNLVEFSEQLNLVSEELRLAVATNRVEITAAIKNIDTATLRINDLLQGLQSGQGLIGSLLRNPQLEQHFSATISNLSVVSSNLSQHGLLWKPRAKSSVAAAPYPGKMPNR
jgi:phospholipid/cholesterol/gamma-HCH transport system substrate-binding protein